jgi:sigma-E factor negative regulatory protein RseB
VIAEPFDARTLRGCVAVLLAVGLGGVARADMAARSWLAQMNGALAQGSYQGEFLHIGHGPVEKLRIFHRVREGHLAERLVSLTPGGRQVVRRDGELDCFLPDVRTVLVQDAPAPGSLLGALPSFDATVEDHYSVQVEGEAQVVGRRARIVSVMPRDHFRFGYRLWIDEVSKMPLRTDLRDEEGRVLEQVIFTALETGAALSDAAFKPDLDVSRYTWVRQRSQSKHEVTHSDAWDLRQLPPGFTVRSRAEQILPGRNRPATHIVVTDGVASVSVFIEEPPGPPEQPVEGQGRLGSAFAYSRLVAGHTVTAVGEVPPATVEYIATGVVPVEVTTPPVGAPRP